MSPSETNNHDDDDEMSHITFAIIGAAFLAGILLILFILFKLLQTFIKPKKKKHPVTAKCDHHCQSNKIEIKCPDHITEESVQNESIEIPILKTMSKEQVIIINTKRQKILDQNKKLKEMQKQTSSLFKARKQFFEQEPDPENENEEDAELREHLE